MGNEKRGSCEMELTRPGIRGKQRLKEGEKVIKGVGQRVNKTGTLEEHRGKELSRGRRHRTSPKTIEMRKKNSPRKRSSSLFPNTTTSTPSTPHPLPTHEIPPPRDPSLQSPPHPPQHHQQDIIAYPLPRLQASPFRRHGDAEVNGGDAGAPLGSELLCVGVESLHSVGGVGRSLGGRD